jgi:hypothetical protein
MKNVLSTIFLSIAILSYTFSFANKVVIYEAPPDAEAANDFELFVNGRKVFVYNTRPAAFAYFSFEGSVDIKVIVGGVIYTHDIRPKNLKIETISYRNEIHFNLNRPSNISVEINKNIKRPLFIFANPMETTIPDKESKDVIFYEAGKIHTPGIVHLKSNQAVYIEGGAIVRGSFLAEKGRNIIIKGRGILDNSRYIKAEARAIAITQCENVLLEGFIITESRHWSAGSYGSRNITYRNLKFISENDWDDGIDIVGSRNVLVDGCFIRTKDDCIAIKAGIDYFSKKPVDLSVDSITVQNCVLWNGMWGNGLEIGFETRADTIKNIVFKDCDLIHVEGPEGTFTIHNGDRAVVQNVLYENIRVEDARGYLFDLKILDSQYTKDKKKGKIRDIYFKNITVEGDLIPTSVMIGFDKEHSIENVTFDNVFIHGRRVTNIYSGMITAKYAENIVYK